MTLRKPIKLTKKEISETFAIKSPISVDFTKRKSF